MEEAHQNEDAPTVIGDTNIPNDNQPESRGTGSIACSELPTYENDDLPF
jgi:hypothetical protein